MPTMTQSCRLFPTGDPVPDTALETIALKGGASDTLEAPYELTDASTSYVFLFWNVDASATPMHETGGTPDAEQKVTFKAPSDDSAFAATAWYLETGGGGGTGGSVWAFSLNKDEVVANSPIASISPASAKTGPNSFSTTSSPDTVEVTAPGLIGGDGLFKQWLQFEGDARVKGELLTVPEGGATAAIAFYGIPVPDPCATLREELASLSPADFPNIKAYEAAVRAMAGEVRACEEKYGEIAVP